MTPKEQQLEQRVAALEAAQTKAETLYTISRGLNTAGDLNELLLVLAQPAIEAGAAKADLFYFNLDEAGNPVALELAAQWLGPAAKGFPIGTRFNIAEFPMVDLVLAQPDKLLLIADVAADERVNDNVKKAMAYTGNRALLVIPLRQASRWVGLININWTEPHRLNQLEQDIYGSLIGLASAAVENRRLQSQTQAALDEAAIFKVMTENSATGILLIDLSPKTLYANRAAHELYGYDYATKELIGQSGQVFWAEEDLPYFQQTVLPQVLAGGWNSQVRQKRKDGTLFETWAMGYPIYNNDGQVTAVSVVVRDITREKQAEAALKNERAFLRQVIDAVPGFIFVKNWESRYMLVNQALAAAHGVTVAELTGKTDADVNPNEADVAQYVRDDQEVMRTGRSKFIPEEKMTLANGEEHWFTTTKIPLVDEHDGSTQLLAISIDVTDRKRADVEREKLQQEIIAAQQHAIAELSTPVIPIMDRIIVLPLVGSIDTRRARDITRSLLAGISQHRAKVVILDVTGVSLMDTGIVDHLNKTIQSARLKGAQTIVTGISDAVAETIVDLGIDWSGVTTLNNLQSGLLAALASLGIKLSQ